MAKDYSIKAVISAVDKFTQPMRGITGGLRGNFGAALGDVGRKAGIVGSQLRGLLGPVAILGSAASVGSIVALVKNFAAGADEVGKFSRQVGFSAESYQELRFVADRAGVSQELFNTSMVAFSKRVGEAKVGTGGLFTILNKLSPSLLAQVTAANSNEEALTLMLNALNKVEDPATRSALAAGAFSRSGVAMTRVAEQGAEGIEALRAEFRRLGGVIGTESTQQAEWFQDAMTNLTASFAGLQNVIGAQLLPVMQPMIEQLTEFVVANREIIGTKISAFVTAFAQAVAKVDFAAILDGVLALTNLLGRAVSFVGGIQNAFIAFVAIMNGPLIISILSLLGSLGKLALFLKGPLLTLLPLVGGALKALGLAAVANPIGATIAVLVGAAALLIANWETVGPFFANMWEGITSTFRSGLEFVESVFGSMFAGIDRLTSGIQAVGNFFGGGGSPSQAPAGPAASSGLGDSGRSALPAQPPNRVNGEIKVKFENAPPGTRVQKGTSNQSALDIISDMGTNMVNWATGG